MYFTRNPIKRMFKYVGAKRISVDAIEILRKHLEQEAINICKELKQLIKHKNKKTATKKDVKYVIKCWMN